MLEAIYKKGGALKYTMVFQCDNGSEFNYDVTKLLKKKHKADIRRRVGKTVVYTHGCPRASRP